MAESMKGLKRTHRCAELSAANVGEKVTIMGWVQKNRNKGGLVFVDGDHNNEANTDDTTADNTTTTPVGDGTTPTKTGDAGVAGIASLAVLSAACALVVLKKKQR